VRSISDSYITCVHSRTKCCDFTDECRVDLPLLQASLSVSLSLCLSVSLSLSVSSVSRCAWLPVCLSARHSDSDSDSDECRVNLPLLQDARQFILFTVVHINMKSSSKAACCSSRPRDEQRTAKANVPPPYTVLISVLCVWRYVFLWSR
jgi:hypothetical protein